MLIKVFHKLHLNPLSRGRENSTRIQIAYITEHNPSQNISRSEAVAHSQGDMVVIYKRLDGKVIFQFALV